MSLVIGPNRTELDSVGLKDSIDFIHIHVDFTFKFIGPNWIPGENSSSIPLSPIKICNNVATGLSKGSLDWDLILDFILYMYCTCFPS